MDRSQHEVTYRLFYNHANIESKAGNTGGSSINFSYSDNGVYYIDAYYEGRTVRMNGHHVIAWNPGLALYMCREQNTVPYYGGQCQLEFEVFNESVKDPLVLKNYILAAFIENHPEIYDKLNISIQMSNENMGIIYVTLNSLNSTTRSKTFSMSGGYSISFTQDASPLAIQSYSLTGNNMVPATLTLNGSQEGVSYQLFNNATPLGNPVIGTGRPITFSPVSQPGTYSVMGTFHDTNLKMDGIYTILKSGLIPSQDNFIIETTMLEGGGTEETIISRNSVSVINYLDGFERAVQTISLNGSPSGNIVNHIDYDPMGRSDATAYLPFVSGSTNHLKRGDPEGEQRTFYRNLFPNDPDNTYTTARRVYDESPLGLLVKEGGVGQVGDINQAAPVIYSYRLNTATDAVKKYSFTENGSLSVNGYYLPGVLNVTESTQVNTGGRVTQHSVIPMRKEN